jgi:hypothetical protein
MRRVTFVLLFVLVLAGWTTCAAETPDRVMPCCAKAQHECPKMEQLKMCCPAGPQQKPNAVAGIVPLASVSVQSHASFLSRAAASPILEVPFRPLQFAAGISFPSRHSIDCILLI